MLERRIAAHMPASQQRGLSPDGHAATQPSSHAISESHSLPTPWSHGGHRRPLASHATWPQSERAYGFKQQGSSSASGLPAGQCLMGDGGRLRLPRVLNASADLDVLLRTGTSSVAHAPQPTQQRDNVRSRLGEDGSDRPIRARYGCAAIDAERKNPSYMAASTESALMLAHHLQFFSDLRRSWKAK